MDKCLKKGGRCGKCGIYADNTCRVCHFCENDCQCPDVSELFSGKNGWHKAKEIYTDMYDKILSTRNLKTSNANPLITSFSPSSYSEAKDPNSKFPHDKNSEGDSSAGYKNEPGGYWQGQPAFYPPPPPYYNPYYQPAPVPYYPYATPYAAPPPPVPIYYNYGGDYNNNNSNYGNNYVTNPTGYQ